MSKPLSWHQSKLWLQGRHMEKLESLRHELERERTRLAACGVVANANTEATAVEARRIHLDYQSDSLSAVIKAVDREIELRERLARFAWIPCSERTPPPKFDVLLWCGWAITGWWSPGGFFTEDGTNPVYQVTHWMPLPQGPTGEKDD